MGDEKTKFNIATGPLYQPGEGCEALCYDLGDQGALLKEFPTGLQQEALAEGMLYPLFRHGLILADASTILASHLFGADYLREYLDLTVPVAHPGFPTIVKQRPYELIPPSADELLDWASGLYNKQIRSSSDLTAYEGFLIGGMKNPLSDTVQGVAAGGLWLYEALDAHYALLGLGALLTSVPVGDSSLTGYFYSARTISAALHSALPRCIFRAGYSGGSDETVSAAVLVAYSSMDETTETHRSDERCEQRGELLEDDEELKPHPVSSESTTDIVRDGGRIEGPLRSILAMPTSQDSGFVSTEGMHRVMLKEVFNLGDPSSWARPFGQSILKPPDNTGYLKEYWPDPESDEAKSYGSFFARNALNCTYKLIKDLVGTSGVRLITPAGSLSTLTGPGYKQILGALSAVGVEVPETALCIRNESGDLDLLGGVSVSRAKELITPCDPAESVLGCGGDESSTVSIESVGDDGARLAFAVLSSRLGGTFEYTSEALASAARSYKFSSDFHELTYIPKGYSGDELDQVIFHEYRLGSAYCSCPIVSDGSFKTAKPIVSAPVRVWLASQLSTKLPDYGSIANSCDAVVIVPFAVVASTYSENDSATLTAGVTEVKFNDDDEEDHTQIAIERVSETETEDDKTTTRNATVLGVLRVQAKLLLSGDLEAVDSTSFFPAGPDAYFQLSMTNTELAEAAFDKAKSYLPSGCTFPLSSISFSGEGVSDTVLPDLPGVESPKDFAGGETLTVTTSVKVEIGSITRTTLAVYSPYHLSSKTTCQSADTHKTSATCTTKKGEVDDEAELPEEGKKVPLTFDSDPLGALLSTPWITLSVKPAFTHCL